MWNSAKLASGAKAPMTMLRPSARTVRSTGVGCSSRLSNDSIKAGVAEIRSRANSATTLMAKATKNG